VPPSALPRSFQVPQQRHEVIARLVMAVCAVLGGAAGWEDIEAYGTAHAEGCAEGVAVPPGLTRPAPCRRVLSPVAPDALPPGFLAWLAARRDVAGGASGALDGTTWRQAVARAAAHSALPLGRAWAKRPRRGCGQGTGAATSTARTAIPKLLKMLHLMGARGPLRYARCKAIAAGEGR
jgi:hypothetical protein